MTEKYALDIEELFKKHKTFLQKSARYPGDRLPDARIKQMYLLEQIQNLHTEGLKILDAGCGYGFVSEYFGKLGHEVIGIDIDPLIPMSKRSIKDWIFRIKRTFSKKKAFCFVQGDAIRIMQNLSEESFDIIIDQCAAHSINPSSLTQKNISEGYVNFYRMALRILKSGGLLIQSTDVIFEEYLNSDTTEFNTESELLTFCASTGFEIVDSSIEEEAPFYKVSDLLGIMTMTARKSTAT